MDPGRGPVGGGGAPSMHRTPVHTPGWQGMGGYGAPPAGYGAGGYGGQHYRGY